MISELDSWLPLDHRDSLREIASEINHALAGFIRGQSMVCLFLGLWYGLGLTLIGLDFGFLIGVLGGLLSFVPYVGSLTALVLSLGVALVQGWPSLTLFFLALGVVGLGQFLEGNVLSPKLVGESDWASPGLVDVCAAGLRGVVRLSRTHHRRSDRGGDRSCEPPSDRALPHKSVLSGPLGRGGPMMSPPRQLTFRWPHSTSFAREDFLPAPSNREALRAIELWPNWAGRMLVLVGPEGAGKSHLGAIWAQRRRRDHAPWRGVERTERRGLRSSLRDADRGRRPRHASGSALFSPDEHGSPERHMAALDLPRARRTPGGSKLRDLLSRLRLAPVARLAAPDIELTEAVLFKLFSDRQLQVEPHVVAYIALRIERSLGVSARDCRRARSRSIDPRTPRNPRLGERSVARHEPRKAKRLSPATNS